MKPVTYEDPLRGILPYIRSILVALLGLLAAAETTTSAADRFRVLAFSKTLLYRHASITNGVSMLNRLGRDQSFAVDATEDEAAFTRTNLARYQVVVFLSTSGNVLNDTGQTAFQEFVEKGGGFVAIHAAIAGQVATEGDWGWYAEALCAEFANHKAIEQAIVRIEDSGNPSVAHLPLAWSRTDEWYNFARTPRGQAHVIAALDESSFHGGTMGSDHPVVWCRRMGQGRIWYTALGHTEASYTEPAFIQHILGGIEVAAGIKPARFEPGK